MNQILFTHPTLQDLDSFTRYLNQISKEDTYLYYSGEEFSNQEANKMLENFVNEKQISNIAYSLFAKTSNEIVGLVLLAKFGNERKRGQHKLSLKISVKKEFRGQGIGKQLLQTAIQKAKELDYKLIVLNVFAQNTAARKLYQQFGFKEYGALPNGFIYQGQFQDEILMYLPLKLS